MIIEKIYKGLGVANSEGLTEALAESMLLSVDVAHAVHPNKPEKYDPINQSYLNEGIVFKIDSNQRYTYDTEAIGILQQICEVSGVKYQKFVNRSDASGGGTLGPIISSWLPMKTVDIGIPLLAMHSAREMMGAKDQEYLETLLISFYQL
jgi:aspartyl aminopeptidase